MGSNCAMSLIQKRCPRRPFDCQRCAAKLQNSETVWELSIPTFKHWTYFEIVQDTTAGETPFKENSPGSAPVTIRTEYKKIPTLPGGGLQNCNFTGADSTLFEVPRDGTTTPETAIQWPDWVSDYQIERFTDMTPTPPYYELEDTDLNPFYHPGGFVPPLPTWIQFSRYYNGQVYFLEPIIESGVITSPGEWRIKLEFSQYAHLLKWNQIGSLYPFDSEEMLQDLIENLGEQAYYVVNDGENSYLETVNSYGSYGSYSNISVNTVYPNEPTAIPPWPGTYKAPDDFTCPIEPGKTYRFVNIIPYDLPPIKVSPLPGEEIEIPAGYGSPKSNVIYPLKPERDGGDLGESFDWPDYTAPPYIDVKHIPRTDQDVK